MHPGKIIPGLIQERKVARKYDVLCRHFPSGRCDHFFFHFLHFRILINGQIFCNFIKEIQRRKTGAAIYPDSAFHRKRQFGFGNKFRRKAELHRSLCLLFQNLPIPCAVNTGKRILPVTADLQPLHKLPVFLYGCLIGFRIQLRPLHAQACYQAVKDQAMLGCNLGRGITRLALSDMPGLQKYGLYPGFL